jgi:signal peptidase
VFYALLIVFVPVFIFSAISKFNGDVLMIGGKSLMVVASGSMSEQHKENDYLKKYSLNNQFDTYDVIILNEVKDRSELKTYDVIAFVNDKGVNVIHRIIGTEYSGGQIRYKTRGDSNNATDEYRPAFDDVLGKYSGTRIKSIGVFIMFFQSYGGMVTIAALVYCLIMMDTLNKRLEFAQDERVKKLREAIAFDSLTNAKEFKTEFTERIYYKGYAYVFNDTGFVEKHELPTEGSEESIDEGKMIRVVETPDSRTSEEIIIQSEEE